MYAWIASFSWLLFLINDLSWRNRCPVCFAIVAEKLVKKPKTTNQLQVYFFKENGFNLKNQASSKLENVALTHDNRQNDAKDDSERVTFLITRFHLDHSNYY